MNMFRWFSDLIYFIYHKEASPPKDVICAEIIYCKLHCAIVKVFKVKQRSKLTEPEEFFRLHFHTIVHILLRLRRGATAELVAQKEESFFGSARKAAACTNCHSDFVLGIAQQWATDSAWEEKIGRKKHRNAHNESLSDWTYQYWAKNRVQTDETFSLEEQGTTEYRTLLWRLRDVPLHEWTERDPDTGVVTWKIGWKRAPFQDSGLCMLDMSMLTADVEVHLDSANQVLIVTQPDHVRELELSLHGAP